MAVLEKAGARPFPLWHSDPKSSPSKPNGWDGRLAEKRQVAGALIQRICQRSFTTHRSGL